MTTCQHCGRAITQEGDRWIDTEATGDDSVWRETCDAHDTFIADHVPSVSVERPVIATYYKANEDAVNRVLESVVGDDGRSDFSWILLASGDVALGVFPTGDGYCEIENDIANDWQRTDTDEMSLVWAENIGTVLVGPGVCPKVTEITYTD
jgi:hypothetical protein